VNSFYLVSFKVDFDVVVVVDHVLDYFQPQEAPSWDREFCGEFLTLRDSNRTVYKVDRISGGGVQSAQPCSKYSVQIVKGDRLMIGFAPRYGFQRNLLNFVTCGWFLSVNDGTLWSQDGTWQEPYGTAIPEGSIVTVIHHMQQHTIEFLVNGKSLGIAFNNIPHENLYAAADFLFFSDANNEIRIIESS
jgi:hypothetical protein